MSMMDASRPSVTKTLKQHKGRIRGLEATPPSGASPTASFYVVTGAAQQPIESARAWVPVILSPNPPEWNWDYLTSGPAVEVISDVDLTPGDRIKFLNAPQTSVGHYWIVGASIRIGANATDGSFPAVDITGYDNDRYPAIMGARIAPSDSSPTGGFQQYPQSMQYAVPRLGTDFSGDYYYFFIHADDGSDTHPFMSFNVSGVVPPNAVSFDEELDPEDHEGLQLQVYNGIEVTPDGAAVPLVDWPATFQGHVWGARYAIGDGVIN